MLRPVLDPGLLTLTLLIMLHEYKRINIDLYFNLINFLVDNIVQYFLREIQFWVSILFLREFSGKYRKRMSYLAFEVSF